MNSSENREFTAYRQAEGMTLHVGQSEGDFVGNDDKIIQAAVNYISAKGGGTLLVGEGEYLFNNSLVPSSNVVIRGCGKTVFKKNAGFSSLIVGATDLGESAATLEDASGFRVGDGIMLTTPKGEWQRDTHIATVAKVEGNTLWFHPRCERYNFAEKDKSYIQKTFPLIYATHTDNVSIEDLVLDGNRDANEHINGNYSAAFYVLFCNGWMLENVVARNYNGDGFSFQTGNDFKLLRCRAVNNADLGFHPGTGALRTELRDCAAMGNMQGFFFCWNVKDSLLKNCLFEKNKLYGINFGHRDSGNRAEGCTIRGNEKAGVYFRYEDGDFYAPQENIIERCSLSDNGIGIWIDGVADDVVISKCRFVNSPKMKSRVGVKIEAGVGSVELHGNEFENVEIEIEDLREKQ